MIDRLTLEGSCIEVHVAMIALKTTKAFTHGGIVFDLTARTVTFGSLPAVALPENLTLTPGATLHFQLVAPDGTWRKQTRSGVLKRGEKQPDMLRISGLSKTAPRFSAADGWGNAVYKYRAYFEHPGVQTTGEVPEWLKQSVARQKAYWNRLAWLCREARRECSPIPVEEIKAFVDEVLLPAIDAFNVSVGRSKDKMKHPSTLKRADPGMDGLWTFVGVLRSRMEKGRPVPAGLLETVVAFAERTKPDYTPINNFLASFNEIAVGEAKALVMEKGAAPVELRAFEIRPILRSFKAVLDRRKSMHAQWSEGWPLLKFDDDARGSSWGLHYYFNKAGVKSTLLETPKGVPGLTFGAPLKPAATGHAEMSGKASARKLRQAEISLPGFGRERWTFRFAVLQHRPLPPESHIKEWKLIFRERKLWLCLVVEFQRPIASAGTLAAGLDVGWRRTESGIRFGTLYEPRTKGFQELTMDFLESPKEHHSRTPFRIDLGPTRWEKRNISKLLPDWKPGDTISSFFEMRSLLAERRSYYKDTCKILLKRHLGDALPGWFDQAGKQGLLKVGQEFKEDPHVQEILEDWLQKTGSLEALVPMYTERSTKRIETGQAHVAHDLCRFLQRSGTNHLVVETSFISKAARTQDSTDHPALKNSQKYRQFAAVGKFITVLRNIALQYGIVVDLQEAFNTTRSCHHCQYLNPSTEKETFLCQGCHLLLQQDQNAAINLSRLGSQPETELWEAAQTVQPEYATSAV